MSRFQLLQPLWDAFRGDQLRPTVILLLSALLLITWKCFGAPDFYLQQVGPWLGPIGDPSACAAVYSFLTCLLLLGVVPALTVKLVFRQRLADYGVQLGNRKRTVRSFLLLAPVFLLAAYVASGDPAMLAEYPINKSAGTSARMFGLHTLTSLVFYAGWEFHFRGFMQFGLRDKLGQTNAILVQVLASCLAHIGKPGPEIYGALLGGILWGVVAARTRSILSGMMQHFLLGIALDWFVCYG